MQIIKKQIHRKKKTKKKTLNYVRVSQEVIHTLPHILPATGSGYYITSIQANMGSVDLKVSHHAYHKLHSHV